MCLCENVLGIYTRRKVVDCWIYRDLTGTSRARFLSKMAASLHQHQLYMGVIVCPVLPVSISYLQILPD